MNRKGSVNQHKLQEVTHFFEVLSEKIRVEVIVWTLQVLPKVQLPCQVTKQTLYFLKFYFTFKGASGNFSVFLSISSCTGPVNHLINLDLHDIMLPDQIHQGLNTTYRNLQFHST